SLAKALAFDGQVYVTGSSDLADGSEFATVAYDAALGTQLWVARYHGASDRNDRANALAADGFGKVYVTGYGVGQTSADYVTVAYDGTDGTQLWVARVHLRCVRDLASAASGR